MKFATLFALALLAAAMPVLAEKRIIQPKEFAPGGPFNPAVLVDGTLYVSGQIGRDLKTQKVPEDFDAEVRQVLDNIGIILREAKMTYSDVVSVQVYLTDMSLFQRMNNIYTTYFKTDRPSRTTVQVVKLAAPEAHLEITVTAHH
jgi:2-iminobutanoate/2-iminopropanoate deaminase